MAPLLKVEGFSVTYGAIRAVREISFAVGEGEVLAFIGPNGAGKSSTLQGLVGLAPATGSVRFAGLELSGVPTEQIVRSGMTLSPEGRRVFPLLTVLENLRLGGLSARDKASSPRQLEKVFALFPKLAERRHQAAGTLSGGEQQMLAIGRALMSAPKLLLLDEPCLGLAPQIAERILDVITRLRNDGQAILLVEQNVEAALDVSDRTCIVHGGRIVETGPSREMARTDALRDLLFGAAA